MTNLLLFYWVPPTSDKSFTSCGADIMFDACISCMCKFVAVGYDNFKCVHFTERLLYYLWNVTFYYVFFLCDICI